MQRKRSGQTKSVSFWRNLFHSAAQQQHEQIELEIQKIEKISSELCRALEPILEEGMEQKHVSYSSFCGCVQVLHALDARKRRLEQFNEVESRENIFNIEKILNSPLVVHTPPLEDGSGSHYGIESNNLGHFVEIIVTALNDEQQQ